MADPITIRAATPGDAAVLSELLSQLGYPATESEIPARLQTLTDFPCAAAFVATNGYGEVIGLVTTHIFPSIHYDHPVAWLTSLVVLEEVRGAGIGSALVRHVEEWAAHNGANRLSVTSALHRTRTHEFYLNREYERTGFRFSKRLSEDTT